MSATQPKGNPGVANRSAPKSPVVPVLVYEDVGKAIEWLCGAFGFTERLRAAGPGGRITHAQLSISGGDIMIGAAGADFRPPRPNEVNQYALVRVEDVERHCDYAKRFGARIVQPLTTMSFGERLYTAEDLAGHRWTFSQSVADVAPEQWGATQTQQR